MRSASHLPAIIGVLACALATEATPQSDVSKMLRIYVATSKEGKPATTFSTDVPTIYAVWKGQALEVGDKIHAVWIAEDIGDAAPKESKILAGDAKVYKADEEGAFTLSRPGGRIWPVGKYRVEVSINGNLSDLAKFTITPGVTIELPKATP